MEDPNKVRMPKRILSSGMARVVTTVTATPARKTKRPLRKGLEPRHHEKPEIKIKLQQMVCCQK